MSSIRSSTMGRSPEMPCAHNPAGRARAAPDVSDDGRSGGVGIQDAAGELLEQVGLRGVDAEVPQLHLRLGPGQRRGAVDARSTSRCLSIRSSTRRAICATQVQNAMRAVPPAGTRRR